MKWSTDEFTGKRFGKYEVLCRLAIGGMAEIFLGFARTGPYVGRPVVLKRILAEQREDPAALQMLIDEAKLTATLNHPNVAQVLDLETDADDVLLVIEFITGANLEELVEVYKARNEPVPLGFALAAIRDAAQGLGHAHGHRSTAGDQVPIIHRDVTPRNVMVDFDGAIKVLDFGIARAKGSERRTQVGMVRGTTAYMSPEQAIGKELDPRTDLFSLGVIAHELLTGTRLFYKGNPAQEMAAVYEGDIPLPSKVNRRVPKAIDPVVMRALERKLEKRYQSALDFTRDLALAASSTTWTRERNAEMVRTQFSERQRDTEKLLSRIPTRAPSYPEGRTQISRGGTARPASLNDDDAPSPKTMIAAEPLGPRPPKPSTPRDGSPKNAVSGESFAATDGVGRPQMPPTDPAREVTDTAKAQEQRLRAGDLFDDLEPEQTTRIVPGPRALTDVATDPRRPPATRRRPNSSSGSGEAAQVPAGGGGSSSGTLIIAAVLALVLGGAGGAFLFKSMQKPGGGPSGPLVPVTLTTNRPADVTFNGRPMGSTPVRAFLPAGHHVVQLREPDAGAWQYEFDANDDDGNTFDVALDSLKPLP